MRGEIETFSSGWSQVALRLKLSDVELFIGALRDLKVDSHFHLRGLFPDGAVPPGIADIEISLQGEEEPDNLGTPE